MTCSARQRPRRSTTFAMRGDMEMEIAQLPAADQRDFLRDLGLEEPARNRFLRHVYAHASPGELLHRGRR